MKKEKVGILLDHSIFKNIPSGRTKFEKIRLYEKACEKHGLVPCFFSLQNVDLRQRKVRAYLRTGRAYRLVRMPIPKTVHNRAITIRRASRQKVRSLSKRGYRIFNRSTRFGKLNIYRRLRKNPALRPHLPETAAATHKTITAFMGKYNSLILKPNNSSIGIGIMKLEKTGRYWTLHYPKQRLGGRWGKIRFTRKLPLLLLKKIRTRKYLVQRTIPLATVNQRPFDLRVSVQRDGSGEWQVTGIAGKLAAKNKFLTNVAQGGRIRRLSTLLESYPELDQERVVAKIERLALAIASTLGKSISGLADLGLDIGIDNRGKPFFIECNARDLRISFQMGRMYKQWRNTYENPIAYARYLMRKDKTAGQKLAKLAEQSEAASQTQSQLKAKQAQEQRKPEEQKSPEQKMPEQQMPEQQMPEQQMPEQHPNQMQLLQTQLPQKQLNPSRPSQQAPLPLLLPPYRGEKRTGEPGSE